MTRHGFHFVALVAFGIVVMVAAFFMNRAAIRAVVLTPGPCVMLGLATADGLDGPHLVIDCDGTQFGVPAVLP